MEGKGREGMWAQRRAGKEETSEREARATGAAPGGRAASERASESEPEDFR